MKEEKKKETIGGELMDRIEKLIEADEQLGFGHFLEFEETTRKDNPCSRTFRITIQMRARVLNNL